MNHSNKSLLEAVMLPLQHDARKHELGDYYAEAFINDLTNYQLLERISDALDQMKEDK